MKYLIRMAVDISTNTPCPASWDEEVVAESKRAAARRFRMEHGLPKAEPLVISFAAGESVTEVFRRDELEGARHGKAFYA